MKEDRAADVWKEPGDRRREDADQRRMNPGCGRAWQCVTFIKTFKETADLLTLDGGEVEPTAPQTDRQTDRHLCCPGVKQGSSADEDVTQRP